MEPLFRLFYCHYKIYLFQTLILFTNYTIQSLDSRFIRCQKNHYKITFHTPHLPSQNIAHAPLVLIANQPMKTLSITNVNISTIGVAVISHS